MFTARCDLNLWIKLSFMLFLEGWLIFYKQPSVCHMTGRELQWCMWLYGQYVASHIAPCGSERVRYVGCKWKGVCCLEGHSGLNVRACERYEYDSTNPRVCECKIVHDECKKNLNLFVNIIVCCFVCFSTDVEGWIWRVDDDLHKY